MFGPLSVKNHSGMHIITNIVMKQNKGLHVDMKQEHKKTTNKTTTDPTTYSDSQTEEGNAI